MQNLNISLFITAITFLMSLTGCYSHKKSLERGKPNADKMNWPKEYLPEHSKFFVHNEIEINAPPEVIWEILIQAEEWPEWYKGAKSVDILQEGVTSLQEESTFSWKTMGQHFKSTTIKEYDPPYRLSWEATKGNIRGYHAWLIIPSVNGSRVVTSEAQNGFLTTLQKLFLPNKLRKLHDEWLLELKNKSEDEIKE